MIRILAHVKVDNYITVIGTLVLVTMVTTLSAKKKSKGSGDFSVAIETEERLKHSTPSRRRVGRSRHSDHKSEVSERSLSPSSAQPASRFQPCPPSVVGAGAGVLGMGGAFESGSAKRASESQQVDAA